MITCTQAIHSPSKKRAHFFQLNLLRDCIQLVLDGTALLPKEQSVGLFEPSLLLKVWVASVTRSTLSISTDLPAAASSGEI